MPEWKRGGVEAQAAAAPPCRDGETPFFVAFLGFYAHIVVFVVRGFSRGVPSEGWLLVRLPASRLRRHENSGLPLGLRRSIKKTLAVAPFDLVAPRGPAGEFAHGGIGHAGVHVRDLLP